MRNTCGGGDWGDEERGGTFPFNKETQMAVRIQMEYDRLRVCFLNAYTNGSYVNLLSFFRPFD